MMRFAAILAALALLGCKDKPASKRTEATRQTPSQERPRLETADVEGAGSIPAVGLGPKIVINKQEITVDGEPVLSIAGDAPLPRRDLDALTHRLETKVKGDEPVALMIDSELPYYRFAVVLDALHKAGFQKLALLTGTGAKMIPLEMLDGVDANHPLVTIKRGRLTLWTGDKQPALSYDLGESPTFQPLTRALAEYVQRRWPDGHRTDADRVISIQLDGGTTAQVLLGTLAAVRVDGTLTLFPSIFLAGGA